MSEIKITTCNFGSLNYKVQIDLFFDCSLNTVLYYFLPKIIKVDSIFELRNAVPLDDSGQNEI
jgi:hypothetical protein